MSDELELQQRRLRLKKAVGELSSMKGMGTELVSLVIPPDKMIHDVRHQLSNEACLLYTSPSPRDRTRSRMPSSA